MVTLKDGTQVENPRFGRLKQFDERSRLFPIMAAGVTAYKPRSYTWAMNRDYVLNQGAEGACVGYAVVNELMARPAEVQLSYHRGQWLSRTIYQEAQRIDPWPGGTYPGADPFYEGTSVLAGVKVAQKMGYFEQYRWAFGLRDLVYGVGHNGPAILGVDWYENMYWTNVSGYVKPTGQWVGGHAILMNGVKLKWKHNLLSWWKRTWEDVDLTRSYAKLYNSWGPGFGNNGTAKINLVDLNFLLHSGGEAVFYVNRKTVV